MKSAMHRSATACMAVVLASGSASAMGPQPCGEEMVVDLVDDGEVLGTLALSNDPRDLVLGYELEAGWLLERANVFVGPLDWIPVDEQGDPVAAEFPHIETFNPVVASASGTIPLRRLHRDDCFTVSAQVRLVRLDAQGGLAESAAAWADGQPLGEGFVLEYCDACHP